MKCILCENWSFLIICNNCQHNFLHASLYKREIQKDFFIYSFYNYEEIQDLLAAKYNFCGDRVLNILAANSFALFAKNFSFVCPTFSLAIDDHTRHEFSHTAILNKHLKSTYIQPCFNVLRAKNIVKYAGKNLKYRKTHKRDFELKKMKNEKLILVDDILTSGTTLKEAYKVCSKDNEVLFALCLADAKFKA